MYNNYSCVCRCVGSEIVIKKEQKEKVQTAASIFNVPSSVVYNHSWHLCAYIPKVIPGIYVEDDLVNQHDQSMSNIHVYGTAFDQCIIDSVCRSIDRSLDIDPCVRDQTLVIHELTNFQIVTDRYGFLFGLVKANGYYIDNCQLDFLRDGCMSYIVLSAQGSLIRQCF